MAQLTFNSRTVLLYLDSAVYDFSICVFRLVRQPVPVYGEDLDRGVVGYAHIVLSEDRKRLEADLFIKYAIPERLDLEVGALTLYARPMGALKILLPDAGEFVRDGRLIVDAWTAPIKPSKLMVDCFEIRALCLTGTPPTDRRIASLSWAIETEGTE